MIGVAFSENGAVGRNVLMSAGVAAAAASVAGILFGYVAEGLRKRR